MHNEGRLYSQVAAQAGVTTERAIIACYLLNLSRDGKSLDEAAALLRKSRADVRDYARDWGISFSDYRPGPPVVLAWEKIQRGQWELKVNGAIVALASSDGSGGYESYRVSGGRRSNLCDGSSAEVAMRRVSLALERASVEVFGADDVQIRYTDAAGDTETFAPKAAADPGKLRRALSGA